MNRSALVLFAVVALTLPSLAQQGAEKPTLVVDSGGHNGNIRQLLFTPGSDGLISLGSDKAIRFWDLDSGECTRVLYPPGQVSAGALSRDGKTLAVAGYGSQVDGLRRVPIYLITLATGKIDKTLVGHAGSVHELAFSADGAYLASGADDGTARIWDAASGKPLHVLTCPKSVGCVAFSPDGTRLVTTSTDAMLRIWSVASGREEITKKKKGTKMRAAWSPDGKYIAISGTEATLILDDKGVVQRSFKGSSHELSFSPDEALLFVTPYTSDGFARMLDVKTGENLVKLPKGRNRLLSPDGKLMAYETLYGALGEIKVCTTADGAQVFHSKTQGFNQVNARWRPDGKAVVGYIYSAYGWFDLATLAHPSSATGAVKKGIGQGPRTSVGPLTFMEKGRVIAKDGQAIAKLQLPKEVGISSFTFLSEERLALGTLGGRISLFDVPTGKLLRTFAGHGAEVADLAPSPDGRFFLSASKDKVLSIWTPERSEPLLSVFIGGYFETVGKKRTKRLEWIVWTPEGYYAASPGGERLMGWHVSGGADQMAAFYPADRFRKVFHRPDVISRLLEAGSLEKALEAADKEKGTTSKRVSLEEALPPEVVLTVPGAEAKLVEFKIKVRARAISKGAFPIADLQLLLDGRPVPGGLHTFAAPKMGAVEADWTVELTPGKQRLSVLARTAVSSATAAPVEVTYTPALAVKTAGPRLFVLSVGINQYGPPVAPLTCAVNDAVKVADAFRSHSKGLFEDVKVKVLTDGAATRQAIVDHLDWLKREPAAQDMVVIYFAGHGVEEGKGDDRQFYFLSKEAVPGNLAQTAVSSKDIKDRLVEVNARRVLFLLDACHSGATGANGLTLELADDDIGVAVITAAMGKEVARERQGHGLFAKAIIDGLSGKAHNNRGVVYLHHLEQYVIDRVQEDSDDQQHPSRAYPPSVNASSFGLAKPGG